MKIDTYPQKCQKAREAHFTIVGEAADGVEVLTLLTRHQPDLLLLDYKMPGLGRLSTFGHEVARRSPAPRILLVSGYVEEAVALEAAADGMRGVHCGGRRALDSHQY